jgi:hypothetical protein
MGERWIWSRISNQLLTPEEHAHELGECQRSKLSAPMIISDCMESTVNHADGQRYSSKRAYEKAVKAAGCEIVGNDSSFKRPKRKEYAAQGVQQDIKRAMEEVSSR